MPPDLQLECFASDPDIVNPIAMTWDERGRLWIAQTTDYPNDMADPGEGSDRIIICEDTDGDEGVFVFFELLDEKLDIL